MTSFNTPISTTSASTQTTATMLTDAAGYTTEATEAAASYRRAQRLSGLVISFGRTKTLIHDVLVDQTLNIPEKNRRDLNAILEMLSTTDSGSGDAELGTTLARQLGIAYNALGNLREQSKVIQLPVNLTRRIDTVVRYGHNQL